MTLLLVDAGSRLRHGPVRFPDGSPPPPHGCRWCGRPTYRHGARDWISSVGTHGWTRPTPAQTLARMKARRAVRAEARRVARLLATAPAAVPVGGRRRVCDEMNHDGRGRETFCQEDPDDSHAVHDDGHGTTWDRED